MADPIFPLRAIVPGACAQRRQGLTACGAKYAVWVFGFSGSEFLLIVIVIAVVVGPSRLPEYTRTLTRLVKRLRVFIENTKEQIAEEVGPELADLDFSELDPRQYDPRKIVREALGEDIDAIKKDLTQPFKSVKEAAEEASSSAVKEANEVNQADRAKGTLAERIEAKKQETKAARELSPVEATGAATAAFVAQRDAKAAQEAALAEAAAASVAEGSIDDPTGWAVDHKKDQDPEEYPQADAAQEDSTAASTRASAAAAAVPPSVVPEEDGAAASRATRPLSPRDIVRAANAAARARAEAREATPVS